MVSEPPLDEAERYLTVAGRAQASLALALAIAAVWSIGGYASFALPLIGCLGMASALPIIIMGWGVLRAGGRWPAALRHNKFALATVLCWLLLLIYMGISLLNPTHELALNDQGRVFLRAIDHIAWLPKTISADRSAPMVLAFAGTLVAAMGTVLCIRRRATLRNMGLVLILNATIAAVVGTWFDIMETEKILGLVNPPATYHFGPFTYKNHWVAYAILNAAMAFGLAAYWKHRDAIENRERNQRYLPFVILCVVIFVTVGLVEARSGLILGALFSALVVAHILTHCPPRWRVPFGIATLGAMGAISWAAYSLAGEEIERQKERTAELAGEIIEQRGNLRLHFAAKTWEMIQDRPVLGHGFGSFKFAYHRYERESNIRPTFAHTDWLQYWAELGTLGFAMLVGPPLAFIITYCRKLRDDLLTKWMLAGLGLVSLLATLEFPASNPAVLIHITQMVAIITIHRWCAKTPTVIAR